MNKLNIQSLLSDYSFVVPEIQREYVWGNKTNKNDYVLRQFLIDLGDKVSNGEANIGFLYSYKSGEEHYLIDGQQRYTTIILLLHYITVKENAYVNPGETIGSVAAPTKYYSAEGSNVYFALTHNGDPVNGEALFH